jgi:hypothetical protein
MVYAKFAPFTNTRGFWRRYFIEDSGNPKSSSLLAMGPAPLDIEPGAMFQAVEFGIADPDTRLTY